MLLLKRNLIVFILVILGLLFITQSIYAQVRTRERISKGIKIAGEFLGDQELVNDVVSGLETVYKIGKPVRIEVKFIRWKIANQQWLEQWVAYYKDKSSKEYTVLFTKTPEIGGTDISIKEGGETDSPDKQKIIIDYR